MNAWPKTQEPAESPAAPLLRYLLQPLDEWLQDPATEEIGINKPGEVWVRQRGTFARYDVRLDLEDCESIAILAGSLRRQEVGPDSPLLATELPDGERLQVCLPPCVPVGTVSLTIRKHADSVAPLAAVGQRYRATSWNRWRSLRASRDMTGLLALYDAGDLEGFLRAAVGMRLNMLLCGPTGSGKTTLSKSLIGAIAPAERIITIEDTLELIVTQPNHVRLLYSKDGLSRAQIDANALLEASLRMRPDRLLLQELRDEAAWVYVNEVVSGRHDYIDGVRKKLDQRAVFQRRTLWRAFDQDKQAAGGFAGTKTMNCRNRALQESGGTFGIGSVWFIADAARRSESAADLLMDQ
jgi:type IV secretion system protein VirB11